MLKIHLQSVAYDSHLFNYLDDLLLTLSLSRSKSAGAVAALISGNDTVVHTGYTRMVGRIQDAQASFVTIPVGFIPASTGLRLVDAVTTEGEEFRAVLIQDTVVSNDILQHIEGEKSTS
ncbi:hypothetical protein CYMTET_55489 [Cymbomonas tetramitiformis]|uniref:Uncharacterized protein n=1 Tax=Cymbomonas tetramitiformis TaxID=36881 RepID=A0AAE0EPP8_9CHLO|nr:hypothetical protein CYMTET_55489 [Cymbomonas tetramitiformis]